MQRRRACVCPSPAGRRLAADDIIEYRSIVRKRMSSSSPSVWSRCDRGRSGVRRAARRTEQDIPEQAAFGHKASPKPRPASEPPQQDPASSPFTGQICSSERENSHCEYQSQNNVLHYHWVGSWSVSAAICKAFWLKMHDSAKAPHWCVHTSLLISAFQDDKRWRSENLIEPGIKVDLNVIFCDCCAAGGDGFVQGERGWAAAAVGHPAAALPGSGERRDAGRSRTGRTLTARGNNMWNKSTQSELVEHRPRQAHFCWDKFKNWGGKIHK